MGQWVKEFSPFCMTNCWFRFFCKAPWRYITTSFAVTLPAQVFKFWNLRHLSKYVHYMLSITRRSHSRRGGGKDFNFASKISNIFHFLPGLEFSKLQIFIIKMLVNWFSDKILIKDGTFSTFFRTFPAQWQIIVRCPLWPYSSNTHPH